MFEKIKREYIKWILKLDMRTPNYILEEETKIKELRTETIKRAIKYKEKARQSEKKIMVECMREIQKRKKSEEESKWEKKRRRLLEKTDG